ncbi:TlpA disulfide reductase family protein [Haloechinothrix sp. LS1_15]|uniref:TlpA family protein disulfide reductase n=1 Tax=Haloechinothrix sp. LS1_15 TaxID=2652248 RepID=UPI002948A37E|nr:TlpA disulfide reductase family protein [Haloechinothrix sp. LS1_15]MDV6011342.1 TlpA family protein disulfide reductase [Haloechinothrix sp. LS1_15]
MSVAARWALVCGALALAGVIALLPMLGDRGEGGNGIEPPDVAASAEFEQARQDAALRPCEGGTEPGGQVPGQVRDVETVCLADGKPVDFGELLAGGTTLVNVWATWCTPCLDELPVLEAYAGSQQEVDVLGVQVDSDPVEGLEMLGELDVSFPSVYDGDSASGPVREALRVPRALPASYLVTPEGGIELITNPRLFHSVDDVRQAVREFGGQA